MSHFHNNCSRPLFALVSSAKLLNIFEFYLHTATNVVGRHRGFMFFTGQNNKLKTSLACTLLALGLQGCGGGGGSTPTPTPSPAPAPSSTPTPAPTGVPASGATVFTSLQSSGNQFSCSNCHAVSEDTDGFSTVDNLHRPAHPLFNVINRDSYQNGNSNVLFDAVNICLQDWMSADSWAESSQQWLDLEAYFQQESNTDAVSDITATQIAPISDFSNGDIVTGQTLFNQTCATCHAENALGSTIAGDLTVLNLGPERVAEKVRTSGSTTSSIFPGLTGGNMPFWSQERLSDENLAHIAVYVDSISQDPTAGNSQCSDTDHAKVGQVANLSTIAHGVSGRAEIINNCTIEVTSFNFDGNAPNVVFYGAANPGATAHDYSNGYSLSDRLDGTEFVNATYTITLDDPSMLDILDGLSVWCVAFGANFGDGFFQ